MRPINKNKQKQLLNERLTRGLVTRWSRAVITLVKHGMKRASKDTEITEAFGVTQYWNWKLGKGWGDDCNAFCNGIPDEYSGKSGQNSCHPDPKKALIVKIDKFWLTIEFDKKRSSTKDTEVFVSGGFSGKGNKYTSTRYPKMEPRVAEETLLMIDIDIDANVIRTKGDLTRRLQELQRKVREVLAHELQHGRQTELAPDSSIQLKQDIDYYLSPREVEAYARGYYELARNEQKSFEEIIDRKINIIMLRAHECVQNFQKKLEEMSYQGMTEEKADLLMRLASKKELIRRLLPEFKDAVIEYAVGRLPCAKYRNGEPVNPAGCQGPRGDEAPDEKGWFDKFKDWVEDKQKWIYKEPATEEIIDFLKDPANRKKISKDIGAAEIVNFVRDPKNRQRMTQDLHDWFMDEKNIPPGISPIIDVIRYKMK